jgi:hypothetical protein
MTTASFFPKPDLERLFAYHPPTGDQPERYQRLRNAAKEFARVLLDVTPMGPDQSAALRHIREAAMTGNASIALEGQPPIVISGAGQPAPSDQATGQDAGGQAPEPA